MKRKSIQGVLLLLPLVMVSCATLGGALGGGYFTAWIKADTANVRSDASVESEQVAALDFGAQVTVTGADGEWRRISVLIDGKMTPCWIYESLITSNLFEMNLLMSKRSPSYKPTKWIRSAPAKQVKKARKATKKTGSAAIKKGGPIVYLEKGIFAKKYHKKGCDKAKGDMPPATLGEAKAQGYKPCKYCKPPE